MDNRYIANNNRIIYVDPNDARGDINGVPLTPDYTTLCISCNLIVERTSRLKNEASGISGDELYAIAFDMSNDYTTNYVSFMTGKDAKFYNFLTTDYTNINYEEIKRRNIIEGLQVESVNIAFINYQTPQVTIKFVDIRGGGFFGREEATHNEYGKLSNLETDENNNPFDNLFSCFVSFPYPRFRLQVKGFYGKPVTFQLTCTNFNGKFNSTTGNFEITVQFIGYEYGVLADIPFDLLIAAPLTSIGSTYWREHVLDMENNGWALDKYCTEAPTLLLNFFENVSGELQNVITDGITEFVEDDATESTLTELTQQIKVLGEIQIYQDEIRKRIKDIFEPYYITDYRSDDENVLIIYNPTEIYPTPSKLLELETIYRDYTTEVIGYKNKYENNNGSTVNVKINTKFTNFISIQTFDSPNRNSILTSKGLLNINEPTVCSGIEINQLFSDTQYTITDGVSKQITEDLYTREWAIHGEDLNNNIPFAGYVSSVYLGYNTKDKIAELQNNYNTYKKKVNEFDRKSIRDIVGFTPYIGRYFKVVMCHLETFVNLFYKCADAISFQLENQLRKPELLGITNLNYETDVPSDVYTQVPPFPAVYKKYTTTEEDDKSLNTGKDILADAWIGDFKGSSDWEERYLVDDLYKAALKISDARKFSAELGGVNIEFTPSIFPLDCIKQIPKYAFTSLDGAKFYAALRAEVALDFMEYGNISDANLAYKVGKIDGNLFASKTTSNEFLRRLYNIENLNNELYNSTVYCDAFINSPEIKYYEFVKVHEGRQPVFIQNGEHVKYNYMINKSSNSFYVPLESVPTFKGTNALSKYYDYETGTDFVPKDINSENFLIGNPNSYNTYDRTAHCVLITDKDKIDNILTTYSGLIDGNYTIGRTVSSEYADVFNRYTNFITNSETDVLGIPSPLSKFLVSYKDIEETYEKHPHINYDTPIPVGSAADDVLLDITRTGVIGEDVKNNYGHTRIYHGDNYVESKGISFNDVELFLKILY